MLNAESFERRLVTKYAATRRRLGLAPARPYFLRPEPRHECGPVAGLGHDATRPAHATPEPTFEDRALRAAHLSAERIVAHRAFRKSVQVVLATAEAFDFRLVDLISESRAAPVTRARQVGMAIAWLMTADSLPQIGRAFRRDHTTVLHGQSKYVGQLRDLLSAEPDDSVTRQVIADAAAKRSPQPPALTLWSKQ